MRNTDHRTSWIHRDDLVIEDQPVAEMTNDVKAMLRASIAQLGIINPLVVEKKADGKYKILEGRNRYTELAEPEKPEVPMAERTE